MRDIFQRHYETNFWKDAESVSGPGSNLTATATIRRELPTLFKSLGINRLLDVACGDFYWFKEINYGQDGKTLQYYIGADVVPEIIAVNNEKYARTYREFVVLDATVDELPQVDMILCRDLLVHFSYQDIRKALKNFRASGSTYLLATTFPGADDYNIETGQWHPVDLNRLRYGLGPPDLLLFENSTPSDSEFANKSLGLWRLNQ